MRPYRIGTSPRTRVADWRSITAIGSGRFGPGSNRPWQERGARLRALLPYAARSAGDRHAVKALGVVMGRPPGPTSRRRYRRPAPSPPASVRPEGDNAPSVPKGTILRSPLQPHPGGYGSPAAGDPAAGRAREAGRVRRPHTAPSAVRDPHRSITRGGAMTMSRGPAPRPGPEDMSDGAAPPPTGDPADVLGRAGRSWTWILASAVVTFVPGVLVLVWPDETLHVLAVLIGLYLLLLGAFRFVAVFGRAEHGERLPALLAAV